MFDALQLTDPAPLSIVTLIVNLVIGAAISMLLGWHFVKFGRTMCNRTAFARILPFVCLTTVLIISVVKSSLALSLGLVGALSIVRFRTPIKEPEELAYVFLAIAVGLGLGADQRMPVMVASAFILMLLAVRGMLGTRRRQPNLYLNVETVANGDGGDRFTRLTELVARNVRGTDLRRVDLTDSQLQATYHVDCAGEAQLMQLVSTLKRDMPDASISFVDANGSPQA